MDWAKHWAELAHAVEQARARLDLGHGEVEAALMDLLQLEHLHGLAGHALSEQRILTLLESYDLRRIRPKVLAEVDLQEWIIPPGVPVLIREARVKVKGSIWTVHQNDADPWPSNPHAHNYDAGLVANLATGELYCTSRRRRDSSYGRLSRKDLQRLRSAIAATGISLP